MWSAFANINWKAMLIPLALGSVVVGVIVLLMLFGTPVLHAFPLSVKDTFKTIRKRLKGEEVPFNMYGLYLYNGLGGRGKTISMVKRAQEVKSRFPKVLICANFHTEVADRFFDCWEDILNVENIDENGVNQGVLFLFDEMHLTLNSQSWKDAPDELLEYISLQRHLHKCIWGSAQEWKRCTKIIREQVNYIIDCKAYFNSRLIINKCYTKENYLINGEQGSAGTRKRPKEWKETFCATDELRSLYDTEEIVKGLKIGRTSEQEKIASRILKAMQD